jgi:hypothetical protein
MINHSALLIITNRGQQQICKLKGKLKATDK